MLFQNELINPESSRSKRYTTHSGTETTRSRMRRKCSGIWCVSKEALRMIRAYHLHTVSLGCPDGSRRNSRSFFYPNSFIRMRWAVFNTFNQWKIYIGEEKSSSMRSIPLCEHFKHYNTPSSVCSRGGMKWLLKRWTWSRWRHGIWRECDGWYIESINVRKICY